jgi:hypothetical protein
MRWTPSIVPALDDQTVYLVADDFGEIDCAWREADLDTTDLETVIQDLMAGEFSNPIRVIAFKEDVSEDIAREVQPRCDLQLADAPSHLEGFVDRHVGPDC